MERPRWLALPLIALLMGCGGNTPPPGTQTSFTREDVYTGSTVGARMVSPAELEQLVAAGGVIVSDQSIARAKARDQQVWQEDLQFLRGLSAAERTPVVDDLLAQAEAAPNPFEEPVDQMDGKAYRLLSLATQVHQLVTSIQQARTPDNALALYRTSYEFLSPEERAGLPTPDTLAGQSLSDIQAATARLNAVLEGRPDQDGTAPEALSLSTSMVPSLSAQVLPSAGNGNDQPDSPCTQGNGGLYRNFSFPLKKFISPVKDQAGRGTCWAFAAVGAVESRERVTNGKSYNLSEQYFVAEQKGQPNWTYLNWVSGEGDDSKLALNSHASHSWPLAEEATWTYNRSWGRDTDKGDFYGVCKFGATTDYTGSCAESASQIGKICAAVPLFGTVCAYLPYEKSGTVQASTVSTLYAPGQSFKLAQLRDQLKNGHVLLLSFAVRVGWDSAKDGFITDLADKHNEYDKASNKTVVKDGGGGGHEVQIVGFVSNASLKARLPNVPQAEGGGYFIIKNSWGCSFDGGYVYFPARFVEKYGTVDTLNFTSERSSMWKLINSPDTQKPSVQIKDPYFSNSADHPPTYYVDMFKPVTLSGVANDLQDGLNCCGNTLKWSEYSAALNETTARGTGPTTTFTPKDYEALVTLSAADSEGNTGMARVLLKDAYPVVKITLPSNGDIRYINQAVPFQATVNAYQASFQYDCAALIWKTEYTEDGIQTGCQPKFTFSTPGMRTVTATYLRGKAYQDKIQLDVRSGNTAPIVTLVSPAPAASFQDGTPITLAGTAMDHESDALIYSWTIVLNPGTPQAQVKDIPTAAGVVQGTRDKVVPLPQHTFKLSDFGAICEGNLRTYEIRLEVTDGFYPVAGLTTTKSVTISKGSCKP